MMITMNGLPHIQFSFDSTWDDRIDILERALTEYPEDELKILLNLRPVTPRRLPVRLGGAISVEGGLELLPLFFVINCSLRERFSFSKKVNLLSKETSLASSSPMRSRSIDMVASLSITPQSSDNLS